MILVLLSQTKFDNVMKESDDAEFESEFFSEKQMKGFANRSYNA